MYEIIFYHDKSGFSDIEYYLDELKQKSGTDKDAAIRRKKILQYFAVLKNCGTRCGKPFVKHIEGDIGELRPCNDRVFFFYWKDNRFVMLHHFVKKTRKTPDREKSKAKANLKDFLERSQNHEHQYQR